MTENATSTFEGLQRAVKLLSDILRLQQIAALGPERVLQFAYHDQWVRFHLPLAEVDLIQRRILAQRTFFEEELLAAVRTRITPTSVVIDAGANIGNHTIYFALICGARHVHAFEPMRVAFSTLQRNIALNGLADRVSAHNVAVGATEGRADLMRYVEHNTGGTVLGLDQPGLYPVVPIDSLQLERCDFVKIDVEGSQIAALDGTAQTIARCRPLIWVELRAKLNEFPAGEAKLAQLGYRLLGTVGKSPNDFLFAPA